MKGCDDEWPGNSCSYLPSLPLFDPTQVTAAAFVLQVRRRAWKDGGGRNGDERISQPFSLYLGRNEGGREGACAPA